MKMDESFELQTLRILSEEQGVDRHNKPLYIACLTTVRHPEAFGQFDRLHMARTKQYEVDSLPGLTEWRRGSLPRSCQPIAQKKR